MKFRSSSKLKIFAFPYQKYYFFYYIQFLPIIFQRNVRKMPVLSRLTEKKQKKKKRWK